jgi:hypothetical protein
MGLQLIKYLVSSSGAFASFPLAPQTGNRVDFIGVYSLCAPAMLRAELWLGRRSGRVVCAGRSDVGQIKIKEWLDERFGEFGTRRDSPVDQKCVELAAFAESLCATMTGKSLS